MLKFVTYCHILLNIVNILYFISLRCCKYVSPMFLLIFKCFKNVLIGFKCVSMIFFYDTEKRPLYISRYQNLSIVSVFFAVLYIPKSNLLVHFDKYPPYFILWQILLLYHHARQEKLVEKPAISSLVIQAVNIQSLSVLGGWTGHSMPTIVYTVCLS